MIRRSDISPGERLHLGPIQCRIDMIGVGMNGSVNEQQSFRFGLLLVHLHTHPGRNVVVVRAMDEENRDAAVPHGADRAHLLYAEACFAPDAEATQDRNGMEGILFSVVN